MKKAEFTKLALTGKPLLVVEYRESEKDIINRKVVKAGESATMPMIKHKILVGNDSWELTQFPNTQKEYDEYKSPYAMRDLVVVQVETMEKTKYGSRMNGEILGKLEE